VRRPAYGWETAGAIIIMENLNVPLWFSAMAAGVVALAFLFACLWAASEADKRSGDE